MPSTRSRRTRTSAGRAVLVALAAAALPALADAPSAAAAAAAAAAATAATGGVISSVTLGKVSITAPTVSVPMSVQASSTFVDVAGFLYPGAWADETPVHGFGQLPQRSAGSTTFAGTLAVDAAGIRLGTLTLGAAAYRTFEEDEVPVVKEVAVPVRCGSRTAVAAGRSGRTVTLTATDTYYHIARQTWPRFAGHRVSFQVQREDGTWKEFATGTTDTRGVARGSGRADTARVWRTVTPDSTVIWGTTSRSVRA